MENFRLPPINPPSPRGKNGRGIEGQLGIATLGADRAEFLGVKVIAIYKSRATTENIHR